MRFAFIQTHARIFHIVTMCRVLEVSKAGYYAWRARPLSDREQANGVVTAQIRTIHTRVNARYGSPRMHTELTAQGIPCGKHRVARLMREAGIRAKSTPKFRVTTRRNAAQPAAPNVLQRRFTLETNPALRARDRVWAADLTYIPTREGWLYLAVILDLASRRVVGWAVRTQLDHTLALTALRMALAHRQARAGLHHSDRGVQYTSAAYQQLLASADFTPSMSRIGNCWDNAVVESFFATLTKELLVDGLFATRAEASREVFEFIEIWYNRQRRHSTLGYRTPAEYEATLAQIS